MQYALNHEKHQYVPLQLAPAFLPVICGYGYWSGNVVWQPDINAVMLLSMGKEQEFFFQLWHHAWLVCFLHYNTIWWQQIFQLKLSSIHRETVKLPPYDDNNNYAFNHILFCETIPYQENCPENREPMSLQFMNKWWLVCFLYCNTIWWKQIPIAILFNPYRKREVAFIWWGHQLPFQSYPFLWNYLLWRKLPRKNREPMSLQFKNKCTNFCPLNNISYLMNLLFAHTMVKYNLFQSMK